MNVSAQDADDAPDAPAKALGVVTCSGSTCHGAAKPLSESKVMQNEFITWHREDRHARAYRSLLGEQGQKIAKNLGLESAANAPECLSCHTNLVPAAQRGKRYNVADGVACEACHGPASKWLGMHVTGEASRADNLKVGMYPTEEPVARAKLCLSCHLGNDSKFATHRIMGAGHPRIGFELDTFTHIQPAHYRVDADYRSRKQVYGGMQVWAVGQVLADHRESGDMAERERKQKARCIRHVAGQGSPGPIAVSLRAVCPSHGRTRGVHPPIRGTQILCGRHL